MCSEEQYQKNLEKAAQTGALRGLLINLLCLLEPLPEDNIFSDHHAIPSITVARFKSDYKKITGKTIA